MDRAEALARLGLDEGATQGEIDAAWRAAIRVVHPDGSHPDARVAIQLNEARAVLMADASGFNTLVPVSALVEVMQARGAGAAAPVPVMATSTPAERAMRTVVMHHVGRLGRRKRARLAAAAVIEGVAGILGLLTAFINVSPGNYVTRPLLGIAAGTVACMGAVVALLGWGASVAEHQLMHELEEVAETLSDRATFVDALNEVGLDDFWTRSELFQALERWGPDEARLRTGPIRLVMKDLSQGGSYESVSLASTAGRIGPIDFAKLLLAKGIELDLIEESTRTDAQGRIVYGYARRR